MAESAVAPVNGVAGGAAAVLDRATSRAATLAAMTAEGFDPGAAIAARPAAEAAPVSSDASVESPNSVDADGSAPVADPADASDPIEAAPVDKPDAETERRVAAVQKAEKRAREQLAKERAEAKAELEQERAEMAKFRAEREQFEQLKARAKYDPAAVLTALGVTEDDFEPLAKDLYARSKGAAADPKNREAAIKMQREREHTDRLAALEKQNAELREQFTKRDAQAAQEAAFTSFVGDVKKAATGEASALFEKSPTKAAAVVAKVTLDLWNETGEEPDHADVLAALDKRLPEMLTVAEYRAIYGDIAKPAVKVAANNNASAPKTLGADITGATPVPKAKTKSLAEQRAETTRLMEQGKLNAD